LRFENVIRLDYKFDVGSLLNQYNRSISENGYSLNPPVSTYFQN